MTSKVHKMGLFRSVRTRLYLEESRVEFRKQTAPHASQPTRERPYRNPDLPFGGHWVHTFFTQEGWNTQTLNLWSENPLNGREKTRFFNGQTPVYVPPVQAHGDY